MNLTEFRYGDHQLFYRAGTSDESLISRILVKREEYALPEITPKTIVDIGANIGITTILMAMQWPDAVIHAFEPEIENFRILDLNTHKLPNVIRHRIGLDGQQRVASLYPSDDPKNLGGFSILKTGSDTKSRQLISVDRVSDTFKRLGLKPPDLMKIDCEGAEYEILKDLCCWGDFLPDFIMGEYHLEDLAPLSDLAVTHNLAFSKAMYQRCFPFYAAIKSRP